jgi:hypothetical protein
MEERPLFESIKPTRMNPPPWVWDRIHVSVSTKAKESSWFLHRLVPAAVVASLFLSMATIEGARIAKENAYNQSLMKVFSPSSSDLLVNWDI